MSLQQIERPVILGRDGRTGLGADVLRLAEPASRPLPVPLRRPARLPRALAGRRAARDGSTPAVFPPIDMIVAALWNGLAGGALLGDIAISLQRAGTAFVAAVLVAIPLGLFMGQVRAVERALDPILQVFRQTSALALYPVFILLLGLGEASKVFVIFWATLFPLLLSTIGGVKEVDPKLIEMARVYGATRLTVFRRVVLPGAVPSIFVGLGSQRDHGAAAADRVRNDRRQQGRRLPGDERAVQLPDPADVRGDRAARRARPDRQLGAGHPAAAALPLEQSHRLTSFQPSSQQAPSPNRPHPPTGPIVQQERPDHANHSPFPACGRPLCRRHHRLRPAALCRCANRAGHVALPRQPRQHLAA